MSALAARWVRFNAVGVLGIGVQLLALTLFKSVFGLHYLLATGLAVETAVLHNYAWHERWTWKDREGSRISRLLRFNLSTGLLSIVSNLVLMRFLVGSVHLPYIAANLIAIAVTSVANFLLSEFFVFRSPTIAKG